MTELEVSLKVIDWRLYPYNKGVRVSVTLSSDDSFSNAMTKGYNFKSLDEATEFVKSKLGVK